MVQQKGTISRRIKENVVSADHDAESGLHCPLPVGCGVRPGRFAVQGEAGKSVEDRFRTMIHAGRIEA